MMADPVQIALIGAVSSFAMALIAAILSVVTVMLGKKNARGIESTKETIAVLEKNTNSIKDALVKVTGESEFAKGLKQGSAGGAGASAVVLSDAQEKAAHSAGMIQGAEEEKKRAAAEKGESPKE